ncbi:MAG: hypothetical protein AAFY57_20220 [Cyanobacteria bacterium J06642_2]
MVVKFYQRWSGQLWTFAIAAVTACSLLCLAVNAHEQTEIGFYRDVHAVNRGDYAVAVTEFFDSIGRREHSSESYGYLCSDRGFIHSYPAESSP